MSDFIQVLKKAVSVIPNDANILLQGDGEDLEISAVGTGLDVRFTITSNYKLDCCVNGKVLCNFLQSAKATDIVLEQGKHSLIARFGDSELELPIYPSEVFPKFSEPIGDKVSVFAGDLRSAFRKVDFVPIRDWYDPFFLSWCSHDPFKASVLLHYQDGLLRVVASDDHRLAVASIIADEKESIEHKRVLLSKDTIMGLENILPEQGEVNIQFINNGLFFTYQDVGESTIIFARLMSGEFPNYEQVIPKDEFGCCDCEIWKENLIQSLSRASLITDVISVVINDDFKISGFGEQGKFKEIVPVLETCGSIDVMCNLKYLLQPLNRIEDEKIKLKFIGEKSPIVLKSKEYIYIVMPVEGVSE